MELDREPNRRIRAWAAAQYEALIPPRRRVAVEEAFLDLGRPSSRHFKVFIAFTAGVLYELHRSLDPEDPWRSLKDLGPGQRPVTVDGTEFGTFADGMDVVVPASQDVRFDPHLVALADGLDVDGARLVAVSGLEFDALRDEVAQVESVDAAEAMRWLLHRRRVFAGVEDPWSLMMMDTWAARAWRVAQNQPWDHDRSERVRKASAVEPGTWRTFSGQEPVRGL